MLSAVNAHLYFLLRCADSSQLGTKKLHDLDDFVKSGCFHFFQPDFGLWAKRVLDCYFSLLG